MKRLLGSLTIITIVLIIGVILVIYAKGNRFDENGKLTGSGILQVDTTPNSAKVFIDGEEKGPSDISIENLKPGEYTLRVEKDHYQAWQKTVEVKKGMVTPIKMSLFPSNPSLSALTFSGVYAPTVSPDYKKVVYGIQTSSEQGLWVLNLTDPQLFFGSSSPKRIFTDTAQNALSSSTYEWSPNSDQVLVTREISGQKTYFLLAADRLNTTPEEVTSRLEEIRASWQSQALSKKESSLKKLGSQAQNLAVGAKNILFSKDQTAALIIKEDGTALVYDSKPSPVPGTKAANYNLPKADNYFWFQGNNKNILLLEGNTISLSDTDGTNKASLFTGDFDKNAVFSWSDGTRVIISINLNASANPLPNLYSLELN